MKDLGTGLPLFPEKSILLLYRLAKGALKNGFDTLNHFFETVISVNRNGGEGPFPKQVADRDGNASPR